jgi:hypothetical protein
MYNSHLLVIKNVINTNAYMGHQIPISDFQGYLYGFGNEMATINLEKKLFIYKRLVI